jgi:hypothetical protein
VKCRWISSRSRPAAQAEMVAGRENAEIVKTT